MRYGTVPGARHFAGKQSSGRYHIGLRYAFVGEGGMGRHQMGWDSFSGGYRAVYIRGGAYCRR